MAAYARRRYIHRAVRTTGQLKGHERKVGTAWVVLMQGQRYHLDLHLVEGGCDITYEGETYSLRTNWKLGEFLLRGTWNGEKVCVQVERMGLKYRVFHWGTQVDAIVMTGRAAELLALMPDKPPPDLSRFLLSPMPGLLDRGRHQDRSGSPRRREPGGDRGDEDAEHPQGRERLRRRRDHGQARRQPVPSISRS